MASPTQESWGQRTPNLRSALASSLSAFCIALFISVLSHRFSFFCTSLPVCRIFQGFIGGYGRGFRRFYLRMFLVSSFAHRPSRGRNLNLGYFLKLDEDYFTISHDLCFFMHQAHFIQLYECFLIYLYFFGVRGVGWLVRLGWSRSWFGGGGVSRDDGQDGRLWSFYISRFFFVYDYGVLLCYRVIFPSSSKGIFLCWLCFRFFFPFCLFFPTDHGLCGDVRGW